MSDLDPDHRTEIAHDALDTGMEDIYWLYNLSRCSRFNSEAYGDLIDSARRLEEDAETLRAAFEKIEDGDLLPAEAALYIAENANFGEYSTHTSLYGDLPITEDGDQA